MAAATLPSCLTELYSECLPDEPCIDDADQGVTCFGSGVRIEQHKASSMCGGFSGESTYRADGSLCMVSSFGDFACESFFGRWVDGDGVTVAAASSSPGSISLGAPQCADGPTVPCDPATARCDFALSCTPGTCPRSGEGGEGGAAGEAGASGGPG
jgi:hypothetical protein